jgi:hypothetical protein
MKIGSQWLSSLTELMLGRPGVTVRRLLTKRPEFEGRNCPEATSKARLDSFAELMKNYS